MIASHRLLSTLQEGGFGMEQRAYSETTAQAMDEEAKKLVDEAYT
jgi:ATP-dependent Zn protease